MSTPVVTTITYSPVKGLALAFHDGVELELTGVRDNRRFYLVADDGRLVNGKLARTLVQVRAASDPDGHSLSLRFPDGTLVEDDVALAAEVETNFYGTPVPGRLCDGPFAEALSGFLGWSVRLVRANAPGAGSDRGSEGSVSLVSTGTLARLAREAEEESIDGRRFRMLFTITGAAEHEEDGWLGRSVAIGDAIVLVREVVGRCVVTTYDPDTGEPDLDTLRILGRYRPADSGEPLPMGVWGQVVQPGTVRVGDRVEAL